MGLRGLVLGMGWGLALVRAQGQTQAQSYVQGTVRDHAPQAHAHAQCPEDRPSPKPIVHTQGPGHRPRPNFGGEYWGQLGGWRVECWGQLAREYVGSRGE